MACLCSCELCNAEELRNFGSSLYCLWAFVFIYLFIYLFLLLFYYFKCNNYCVDACLISWGIAEWRK